MAGCMASPRLRPQTNIFLFFEQREPEVPLEKKQLLFYF
jgi:hypothetical protein